MEDRTRMMGEQTGMPAPGNPGGTVMGGRTQLGMNRTQMMGATQMGNLDPGRTVLGAPGGMQTLAVECLAGNRFAYAPETSRENALIVLKSGGSQVGRRAPINVCLCIDRSGSMEGEPLEYVKRACEYVVDMLEPNDILSIVTFEESVDVLMPARRVVNKSLVKDHIRRLEVGNTTNLYDGMVAACMQISAVLPQTPGYVNRVLLLTDGEPTSGIKDYGSIVQQVAEQKMRGISITALGFGGEYNEELMAGIARRSGGNYYYIQRADLLPEVFRRELESLMTVVAKSVKVRLRLSRWVRLRQIYGMQPTFLPDGRTVEVEIPDMERGTSRTLLAELEYDRHPAGTFRVLKADVEFDDVVNNRADRVSADCVLEFTNDRTALTAGANPVVRNELEIALASQSLQRTMMGMKTQQLTALGAISELQRTRTILANAGQSTQVHELDSAVRALQTGGDAEKTIIGTIYNLDLGKRQ